MYLNKLDQSGERATGTNGMTEESIKEPTGDKLGITAGVHEHKSPQRHISDLREKAKSGLSMLSH